MRLDKETEQRRLKEKEQQQKEKEANLKRRQKMKNDIEQYHKFRELQKRGGSTRIGIETKLEPSEL